MVLQRCVHESSHGQQVGTTVAECLLYANGVLVHVVTAIIDSKATEKPNWDYNWKLDLTVVYLHLRQGLLLRKWF